MASISKSTKERSRLSKEEWREYTKTVWHIANVKNSDHPAVFPEEIPMRLIKLFTFVNEVVLDPFAGTGTTGSAALKNHRKAVCVDHNNEYVSIMERNFSKLDGKSKDIVVFNADSRCLAFLKDESISLIVTSPPYWNKSNYGHDPSNLGAIEGYRDFLKETEAVWKECYRVLLPGRKICIVTANVNQYTNHGLLTFPLAADFAMILREIGFIMVNEIIWSKDGTGGKWGSWGTQRPIFGSYPYPPNFLFKNVHEYVLIFAKPDPKKKNGKKAKNYESLMGLKDSFFQ